MKNIMVSGNIFAAVSAAILCVASGHQVFAQGHEADVMPSDSTGELCAPRYGVTVFSVNYLREKPDFAAELGTQALMGTPVEILDESGYWRKVRTPEPYVAWCVDMGVKEMSPEEMSEYIAAEKIVCTADYSVVWNIPGDVLRPARGSKERQKICDIVAGDLLPYSGRTEKGCYEVRLLTGETGYIRRGDAAIFSDWAAERSPEADNIIETATDYLGVPYLWGGTSIKGVDCSGLTRMAWFMNGILLPRNASQQARAGKPVPVEADTVTYPVDSLDGFVSSPDFRDEMLRRISSLQKGDLIFFGSPAVYGADSTVLGRERITHVGIYLGEGSFIHSSRVVRINSLIPGTPDFYDLSGRMIKARRIIGSGPDDGVIPITSSPAYFPWH